MLLLLVTLSSLAAGPTRAAEPVPLSIGTYYEALCPDSRDFVVNQLNITYSRVPEILDLTFVPWGKAVVGADGTITCQHGAEECWGNRLLACASAAVSSELDRVLVVSCLMYNQKVLDQNGPACLESVGLSWEKQTTCAESDQSYQQAVRNGALTAALDPALVFVPTVTLDGSQGSPDQQNELLSDLLGTVCTVWQSRYAETPAGCP